MGVPDSSAARGRGENAARRRPPDGDVCVCIDRRGQRRNAAPQVHSRLHAPGRATRYRWDRRALRRCGAASLRLRRLHSGARGRRRRRRNMISRCRIHGALPPLIPAQGLNVFRSCVAVALLKLTNRDDSRLTHDVGHALLQQALAAHACAEFAPGERPSAAAQRTRRQLGRLRRLPGCHCRGNRGNVSLGGRRIRLRSRRHRRRGDWQRMGRKRRRLLQAAGVSERGVPRACIQTGACGSSFGVEYSARGSHRRTHCRCCCRRLRPGYRRRCLRWSYR